MKRSHPHRKCSLPAMFVSLSALVLISISILLFLYRPSSNSVSAVAAAADPGSSSLPELPRFSYFISGTAGDSGRLRRLLRALYHPRNYYLLHLDFAASDAERLDLAKFVKSEPAVSLFQNVMVMGKGNLVTSKGPTVMASTLHAAAILLRKAPNWDWFINIGSSDYPLMPQDDILHIFSYLPRDLNFIEHTSDIGWKEFQRARPIIIDPGLYHSKRSGVFWAKEKRSLPASFKLFMGSALMILSRSFLEFCIWGWDNLPRTLLMYYTNTLSSEEAYFHTVACNHRDYQNTTVNHSMRYVRWDEPPREEPANLTARDFDGMVGSGAPFGHSIPENDPLLDLIDRKLLLLLTDKEKRNPGDGVVVRPHSGSKRLEKLVVTLLDSHNFRSRQCK
ncbi:hypothetical protein M569_10975 [Genlisea aurea]|uniref:Glycosyltransferase family 14 protein n=1 Tax=Genlisea aurea TaxID=192259 RepID=S8DLI7_9LAMI|nr:hypothetical protein M569_10975 [Genlisea aurea]